MPRWSNWCGRSSPTNGLVEDEYHFRDQAGKIAFTDKFVSISMGSESPAANKAMVDRAPERGWRAWLTNSEAQEFTPVRLARMDRGNNTGPVGCGPHGQVVEAIATRSVVGLRRPVTAQATWLTRTSR